MIQGGCDNSSFMQYTNYMKSVQAPLFFQDRVPVQQGLSQSTCRASGDNDGIICSH